MTQQGDNSKEEDLDLEQARLITETGGKDLPDIPLCGFMSVRYYQPYFDVDTADVLSRLSQAVFYCRREQVFMATIDTKPDAYGPFWIATTLVFVLGVASHLNGWFASWLRGATMEYNFQSIVNAASVVFSFAVLAPAACWLVFRTYDDRLRYAVVFCLYGYALVSFIPAVLLCLVPNEWMTWLSLLAASVASGLFLLRNLAPLVLTHPQHASYLLSAVGLGQVIFGLSLKLYFFPRT